MRNDIPLSDCARHLARLYLTVPPDKRGFVSTLRQQCKRYHQNPEGLRPMMLETIDAIEIRELGQTAINAEER